MPNKNYLKGYNVERLAKKELEENNWQVIRSAGSHSPIDLVAWDVNAIRLIQIKSTQNVSFINGLSKSRLITELSELKGNCPPNSRIELWVRFNNKWDKTVI